MATSPASPASPATTAGPHLPQVPRWQSMLRSFALAKDPLPILNQTLSRFGDTVRLYIGGVQPSILTQDPGLINHILQKNHRNYSKSKFTQGFARYIGHGLLTNEGADWLRQRRLIQPGFHRQRVAGLTGLMQEIIAETIAPLRTQAAANDGTVTVPAHELMTELTFRIIARSVFSTNFSAAELNHVARLITEIQAFYVRTIRQPYLNPWFRLRVQFRYHDQLTQELRTLLGSYIARRRRENEMPEAITPPDDLLQMLLDVRYEDTGLPMTDEQVLDEALILLIAGHETSANALTWLLYLIGQHPQEAQAIRAETAAVLASRGPEQAAGLFAFEELPRLGRALYAVQEAMRLYPPAWMVDRVALADDEYQGLPIPKGTLFSLYIYGLHNAPKHWQRPTEFRPERFAPGQGPVTPGAYLPFGGGPRLCIGMQFALTEMQLVTLELLRHFDVALPAGLPAIPTQPLITLRPKGDFAVQLSLQ
ncbi:cytochrome P450 [Hymenobacter chitinivorans]|uniref:Cytochrome P450 n=1 Tax=Hymenobacter chitinivorans DSM 11115 TaxID=1121954 RepID=A0A2M9BN10_9BACT|nr:cytochrome P450 [Hymenobacter chitinivorans]PJJ59341.1 cytochrome P450 [Hymenobacter chitinivorans DSM 11115]